jgi:hypothetical protein
METNSKSGKIKLYWQLIGAMLVGLFVVVAVACYAPGRKPSAKQDDKKRKTGQGIPFEGGIFNASGVAQIPGTDAVLFVDDDRKGEKLLWMRLDAAGRQVGRVEEVALDTNVEDPEGITFDGTYFYIISSQSNPKSGAQPGLIRFSFDHAGRTAHVAGTVSDLREFLVARVPELKNEGERKGKDDGLNIEGIAWDPQGSRLLLGLRSPLAQGRALLLPLKQRDPLGPFSVDNLTLDGTNAITLPLGGNGIRDIAYDGDSKSFLIVSGPTEQGTSDEFSLWQWDGSGAPIKKASLDAEMKPEGVTRFNTGAGSFILLFGDASSYLKLDR